MSRQPAPLQLFFTKACIFLAIWFLLTGVSGAFAQVTLNSGTDTLHNSNNRLVVKTLVAYINARLAKQDGKAYWRAEEVNSLNDFDLYNEHSLYQISYRDIIVLGITQPEKDLFRVKVMFDYVGTDKVKTVFAINEYYLIKQGDSCKLTNALYQNMRFKHYQHIASEHIDYYFPSDYHYQQSLIDSANAYLNSICRFFEKKMPGRITYVTASTCENVYAMLGSEYFIGTESSTTTFCGYFDGNNIIITSGNEFYRHELMRTINLFYRKAPDIFRSGVTALWSGSVNNPIIYHLKRLYPYLKAHPEVLDDPDSYYYFDDETNPGFVFEAVIVNYVIKKEGKQGLLALATEPQNISIKDFLKKHFGITDTRKFFLDELSYYASRSSFEFDDIEKVK